MYHMLEFGVGCSGCRDVNPAHDSGRASRILQALRIQNHRVRKFPSTGLQAKGDRTKGELHTHEGCNQ